MTVFIYLLSIQNLNKTCKIYYNYSVLVLLRTGSELYIICVGIRITSKNVQK